MRKETVKNGKLVVQTRHELTSQAMAACWWGEMAKRPNLMLTDYEMNQLARHQSREVIFAAVRESLKAEGQYGCTFVKGLHALWTGSVAEDFKNRFGLEE